MLRKSTKNYIEKIRERLSGNPPGPPDQSNHGLVRDLACLDIFEDIGHKLDRSTEKMRAFLQDFWDRSSGDIVMTENDRKVCCWVQSFFFLGNELKKKYGAVVGHGPKLCQV